MTLALRKPRLSLRSLSPLLLPLALTLLLALALPLPLPLALTTAPALAVTLSSIAATVAITRVTAIYISNVSDIPIGLMHPGIVAAARIAAMAAPAAFPAATSPIRPPAAHESGRRRK